MFNLLIEKIMPWGPVIFGVCVFAPMWAAAMNAVGIALPFQMSNLSAMLILGFSWGLVAKYRERWL